MLTTIAFPAAFDLISWKFGKRLCLDAKQFVPASRKIAQGAFS